MLWSRAIELFVRKFKLNNDAEVVPFAAEFAQNQAVGNRLDHEEPARYRLHYFAALLLAILNGLGSAAPAPRATGRGPPVLPNCPEYGQSQPCL
jgi:hypothetical protein